MSSWTFPIHPPPPPPPHHPHHHRPGFPFWDFDANEPGRGVDHAAQENFWPLGGPEAFFGAGYGPWRPGAGRRGGHRFSPWGHHQADVVCGRVRRGRRAEHEDPATSADEEMREQEKEDTPSTTVHENTPPPDDGEFPDPPEEIPDRRHDQHGRRRGGGGRGRGGPHARGGGRFGHGHHRHPRGPPPAYEDGANPWDFRSMMRAVAEHPFVRQQMERARAAAGFGNGEEQDNENEEGIETFVPPVDLFDGAAAWTVHVAVPGAKKEDTAVSWDAVQSSLTISGIVHRPGDEELLSNLVSGERKIGLFRRKVRLPPAGAEDGRDEVDGDGIAAKMEDGVLVVTVPKLEREWTEVRKVDIE